MIVIIKNTKWLSSLSVRIDRCIDFNPAAIAARRFVTKQGQKRDVKERPVPIAASSFDLGQQVEGPLDFLAHNDG